MMVCVGLSGPNPPPSESQLLFGQGTNLEQFTNVMAGNLA